VDAAEVAIGEFAAGQEAVFEFDGAHGGAFGVKGVAFGGHADIVDIGAAELGAFDLEVAEVGVDDLHIAGVEWWTRICSMLVKIEVNIAYSNSIQ
jgi:hypothetical protein